MRLTIPIAVALSASSLQAQQQQSAAPATVAGTWRGESICTDVGKPRCHDEIAIYHFARADNVTPDGVEPLKWMGNKEVAGVEEWMGMLDCEYRRAAAEVRCPMNGGMWRFQVRGDSLVGTLTIPSGQIFRNVRVKRVG